MNTTIKKIQECLSSQNKVLVLQNAEIKENSPEAELLKKCSHLNELYLGRNHFEEMIDFSDFANLQKLDLSDNKIKKIVTLVGDSQYKI